MKHNTHAIYQRGETHIQNTAHTKDDGTLVAAYTDGELASEYVGRKNSERKSGEPEYEILPFDEAMPLIQAAQENKYCDNWTEITKEQWDDALNVMPPEKWRTEQGVEIFRMCEYLTGDITCHYARLDNRYFASNQRTSTPYDIIAKEVATVAKASQPAAELAH